MTLLPPKAQERLQALMVAGWTGKVELHVKDGCARAWSLTWTEREGDISRTITEQGRG